MNKGIQYSGAVAAPFSNYRVGGQVPNRENIEMMKLAQTPAKPFNPMRLLDHTEPRMTVDSVIDGLGFDPAEYTTWRKFLQKALDSDSELLMRRDVMSKAMAERLNPQLRRALFQRALCYYRGRFQKSMPINVLTLDEYKQLSQRAQVHYFYTLDQPERQAFDAQLEKAEARGGTYHRRVPRSDGKGFTYYYDPKKYDASKNAHVDGPSAAKAQIKKGVQKLLDENKGSCALKGIKHLVKRYGAEACSTSIKEMQSESGITFKGGKLRMKKSDERFTIQGS